MGASLQDVPRSPSPHRHRLFRRYLGYAGRGLLHDVELVRVVDVARVPQLHAAERGGNAGTHLDGVGVHAHHGRWQADALDHLDVAHYVGPPEKAATTAGQQRWLIASL